MLIGLVMLVVPDSVCAGSVPDDLLFSDDALLFFGEIVSVDKKSNSVTVYPVAKIKGDVTVEVEQEYLRHERIHMKKYDKRKIYLMAYDNEHGPLYIMGVTGTDTSDLKIEVVDGNMWGRLEKLLNELKFEEKEAERLRLSDSPVPPDIVPTSIPEPIYKSGFEWSMKYYLPLGFAVSFATGFIFTKLNRSK